MKPATLNSKINPYTFLLAENLTREGIEVREFSWSIDCFVHAKIIHFHWPNEFFVEGGTLVATLKSWVKIFFLMLYRRMRGGRVVWTVHNVWPHESRRRHTPLLGAFLNQLDGVAFLSKASKDMASIALPPIGRKPFVIVKHGHYLDISLTPPQPPGRCPPSPIRLGFFGQVRPYKNVARLVRVVSQLPAATVTLVVAGECRDSNLRRDLEELASGAQNITLDLRHLSLGALEQVVDDCHAIVFPYRDILNSGSALYALSRSRPIMVPSLGSLPELEADVGPGWVFSYSGGFDTEKLNTFFMWLRRAERAPAPMLASHAWSRVSSRTKDFYGTLVD